MISLPNVSPAPPNSLLDSAIVYDTAFWVFNRDYEDTERRRPTSPLWIAVTLELNNPSANSLQSYFFNPLNKRMKWMERTEFLKTNGQGSSRGNQRNDWFRTSIRAAIILCCWRLCYRFSVWSFMVAFPKWRPQVHVHLCGKFQQAERGDWGRLVYPICDDFRILYCEATPSLAVCYPNVVL